MTPFMASDLRHGVYLLHKEGGTMMRSTAVAYEQVEGTRFTTSLLVAAQAAVRRIGAFLQLLAGEFSRLPDYQDEAERLWEVLREGRTNSEGRDGADLPNA